MNRTEHLLSCLAEECAEVVQRASKALRFGLSEVQPGQEFTNQQRLWHELNDLAGVAELLIRDTGAGGLSRDLVNAKKDKVEQFLSYSEQCGTLTPSVEVHGSSTTNMLRSALVGLIGADTEPELRQMAETMRMLPAPEADKAVSINAIHALLATMPAN